MNAARKSKKMDYLWHYDSPLGTVTLASDGISLTGLWFDGQKHFGSTLSARTTEQPLPVFTETAGWLDLYFKGTDPGFVPPVFLRGTPFRLSVWNVLREIPYGQIVTYGQIAAAVAKRNGLARMSAQAVGGAVGRNPVSLIVPCHRVIAADGNLTGYAGGIGRKRSLLLLEGVPVSR